MAKPRKVKEPTTSYTAKTKKPAPAAGKGQPSKERAPAVHTLDEEHARKLADKIFTERKDLLHRLAQ